MLVNGQWNAKLERLLISKSNRRRSLCEFGSNSGVSVCKLAIRLGNRLRNSFQNRLSIRNRLRNNFEIEINLEVDLENLSKSEIPRKAAIKFKPFVSSVP